MLRILIVHDDVAVASEMTVRLTRLGYEVAGVATSGDEAVAAAASSRPGLLLVEAGLAGALDHAAGEDPIRHHRSVPVVFVGTEAEEARLERAGIVEPNGFLVLPFSDRELRTSIALARCRHDAARSEHELEGFFAVSLDMFCFLDFNGYFRLLNPAWERTLGFTRAELMSRPFIEFVHPDDRERTLKQNAEVRGGGQAKGFENRYLCKDGSYRWLLWNATPRTAEGVIFSVARDITSRKQAEDERAQLLRTLEASLAEVKTLRDILPICMYCKHIRDDEDYWHSVESYISLHTKTMFSHAICPSCMATRVEPDLADDAGA